MAHYPPVLLPALDHKYGYTRQTLEQFFDTHPPYTWAAFEKWIADQTMAYIEGLGVIYYHWDVSRFVSGLPIID